jgi:hypothetical protein
VSDLSIFTVTWARDDREQALLVRTLGALAATGYPVTAADRTSTDAFRTTLAGLGIQVVQPAVPNLVAQVQAAATAAAAGGSRYLLYTEPDKELFFQTRLADFVANIADEVDVTLAARNEDSFATFPPMQQYVETVVNTLSGQLTGTPGDFCYGPFVMHRSLLPHVASLPHSLGWGWRPSIFLSACNAGRGLRHWVADLPCPPEQRTEDASERRHRLRQLSQNISGLCAE